MNAHRFAALVALSACSGCVGPQLYDYMDYRGGTKAHADVVLNGPAITGVDIGESVKFPGRIWVGADIPSRHAMAKAGQIWNFAAMRPEVDPVFQQAALAYLAQTRKGCAIVTTIPNPNNFGMEYAYRCD